MKHETKHETAKPAPEPEPAPVTVSVTAAPVPTPTVPAPTLGFCGACVYYGTVHGYCRVNPPMAVAGSSMRNEVPAGAVAVMSAYWPVVDPNNDWCGQWIAGKGPTH